MDKDQYLRHLYYDPDSPVAYSGLSKIWSQVKEDKEDIKYKEVKEFLQEQPTYTLHKAAVKKFTFRKTMVSYVDQQWQADLVDMQKYKDKNNNYNYILTVIDIFSRYAWARPLKRKEDLEVKKAFEEIFGGTPGTKGPFTEAKPDKIQFDDGKEFYNKHFKDLLTKEDIEWFSTFSDKKAAVVERYNRTLKTRMWKYFTAKEIFKWIDVLDDFVKDYNNSFHSSIGMKPEEARKEENSGNVWYNLYGSHLISTFGKPKYKVGDSARISKYKSIFTKGYLPNFTEEVFKIKQTIFTQPIVYKLEDFQSEDLDGYFYEQELSYVPNPDQLEYKIEKVLRYKTIKGKKYGLVKWKGYGDKFNSWEPVSEIKSINYHEASADFI